MLVNGAVASAHASIAGQEPQLFTPANNVTPQQVFRSASLSIDSRVSDKLKFKIWNEEFVEFGSLLSNPGLDDKYQVSFQQLDSRKPASFCLEPASKPRKIPTIDNWLRAFHIFVGVYTQKHPCEAPALMKYGETIQDLAARGQNWRFYDENFRGQNCLNSCAMGNYPLGIMVSFPISPSKKVPCRTTKHRLS